MADNDWKSRLGVVFSTNPEFGYKTEEEEIGTKIPATRQKLIVSLEKRNRGGKKVTIVSGFSGSEQDMEELGREIRSKCGTGGTVKDGEIVIQGDFRDRVVSILCSMSYNAKRGN